MADPAGPGMHVAGSGGRWAAGGQLAWLRGAYRHPPWNTDGMGLPDGQMAFELPLMKTQQIGAQAAAWAQAATGTAVLVVRTLLCFRQVSTALVSPLSDTPLLPPLESPPFFRTQWPQGRRPFRVVSACAMGAVSRRMAPC